MRQMNFAGWLVSHIHTATINLIVNGIVTVQRSMFCNAKIYTELIRSKIARKLCVNIRLQPYLCKISLKYKSKGKRKRLNATFKKKLKTMTAALSSIVCFFNIANKSEASAKIASCKWFCVSITWAKRDMQCKQIQYEKYSFT